MQIEDESQLPSVTLELKWNKSRGTSRGESHCWKVERAAINIASCLTANVPRFSPLLQRKVYTSRFPVQESIDPRHSRVMWNKPRHRENNFFFLNCWIRDNNDNNIDSWQAIASFLSEKSKERGIRRWILEEGEKEKRMSWKLRLDGYVESSFRDSSSIDDRSKSRFDAVIAGGYTRFVRNFTLFSVERKWLKIYEREERDASIKFSAQIQFFLKKNPRKTQNR